MSSARMVTTLSGGAISVASSMAMGVSSPNPAKRMFNGFSRDLFLMLFMYSYSEPGHGMEASSGGEIFTTDYSARSTTSSS